MVCVRNGSLWDAMVSHSDIVRRHFVVLDVGNGEHARGYHSFEFKLKADL